MAAPVMIGGGTVGGLGLPQTYEAPIGFAPKRRNLLNLLWKETSMTRQEYGRAAGTGALFLTAVTLAMGVPAARAQYNASIQGTVTDPQGAVVPNAAVTLTNTETNQVVTHTSSSAGVFTFNQLPPSQYTLVVVAKGFTRKELNGVQVTPEQANSVNVQLGLGSDTQTVTVSGEQATTLETETATISGTISSNQIQHLPSFGRDVFQLAQLAPGTFGDGAQAAGGGTNNIPGANLQGSGATDGIFKTENQAQISGNGGQNSTNGISINGISTVSAVWGGASVITPSEDSVKDVHIISNGYDASNGRFSSSQIQVVTKNGTNQVHGSAFVKIDRPGLNAYQRNNGPNSFGPGSPAARGLNRDQSRFNQFGGTIGGPLWKNRVFAFFAYEGLRDATSVTAQGWYESSPFESLAAQGTIASQFLGYPGEAPSFNAIIPRNCASIGLSEGVNCATVNGGLNLGTPRTGATRGTLDPTWTSSLNPGVGNGLGTTPTISFLNTLNPTNLVEDQYNGRLDVQASSKDLVTFTVYWVPSTTTDYNTTVRAADLWHHEPINDAFTGIWNHTFSASLLNEARANAAGWRWNEISTNPQAPFGLPIAQIDDLGSEAPPSNSSGSSGIGFSSINSNIFGAPGPSVFNQWTYSYADILTKVLGSQQIKVGGDVTRLYYLNNPTYVARPQFYFRNLWDFLNDAPYKETGSFDPLTGAVTANRQDIRSDIWSAFVQDDWKVRPNLTLNLGVRYSYFGPISSKENNLAVFQQGAGASTLTGASIRVGGNLYSPQKLNFGPQIGFAWSPAAQQGRVVVRGGYGLNFNQEEIAIQGNGANNPPLITSASFCCSVGATNTILPSIQYNTASNVKSLYGYPNNSFTVTPFNSSNLPASGGTVNVTAFPSNVPTNYTYHYSLDTQIEFAPDWVATIGYQGSTSRHLIRQYNQNVVAIAEGIPVNPQLQQVDFYGNDNNSNYNALLTTLRHNFSHQFQAEAQYTWSKSMDNGSQPYYEDPYPYNNRLSYGRSDYNVGNVFKLFGLWQPVFFRGSHGLLEKTVGGWSVSGILNLHTGFPWTPVFSDTGGGVYYNGSTYMQLRPAAYLGGAGRDTSNKAFLSGPSTPGSGTYNNNYSNGALTYFTIPTFTAGPNFPNAGSLPQNPGVSRNSLNGPNYIDADMTLAKAFGLPKNKVLGESGQVEIRADAYNIYNRLNLNGSSINNTIESNNGDGTFSSNPAFGQVQSALGSRTIEAQARFSF